jgi:hypothetical protein
MTNKELKFLDFILPILKDKYPDFISVGDLNSMYKKQTGIDLGYRELPIFVDKYENVYFEKVSKMKHLRIMTDYIEIIEIHGSLSKYLESIDRDAKNKNIWIAIRKYVIPLLSIIVVIVFGILNEKQKTKNSHLENEIIKLQNEINIKDSIINNFNVVDTIKN